jgi:hypothetical protein
VISVVHMMTVILDCSVELFLLGPLQLLAKNLKQLMNHVRVQKSALCLLIAGMLQLKMHKMIRRNAYLYIHRQIMQILDGDQII